MYEMYEDLRGDDVTPEKRCYCGEAVSKHARETHEIKSREIRCHLLQSEITAFLNHDALRAALSV